MKKKSKKPASETFVNSILKDLQDDNEVSVSVSRSHTGTDDKSSAMGRALLEKSHMMVPEEARELPEGLESKTALFGVSEVEKAEDSEFQSLVVETENEASRTLPVPVDNSEYSATRRIGEDGEPTGFQSNSFTDRTQPMIRTGLGPAGAQEPAMKVSHGVSRPLAKSTGSLAASVTEAQMLQAENLRLAQARILDLEKEVEKLRQENELLSSAGEIVKKRAEELFEKVQDIDRARIESLDQAQMEMNIYRENLTDKDKQLSRSRQKIEELETRLAKDLKKIRVRERELENRLELSKMEKTALVRAKDEAILELKGRLDQLHQELETYRLRCADLNQKVDGQHEQLGRTVRALRLALTHLEANDTAGTVTPLKKAE